jgi:hypothetical protein
MAKRKYARTSDTNITSYECLKKKCKWQGTDEEKAEKKIDFGFEMICPNCGNPDFFGLIYAVLQAVAQRLRLCAVGEIEAQMFVSAQKPN